MIPAILNEYTRINRCPARIFFSAMFKKIWHKNICMLKYSCTNIDYTKFTHRVRDCIVTIYRQLFSKLLILKFILYILTSADCVISRYVTFVFMTIGNCALISIFTLIRIFLYFFRFFYFIHGTRENLQ